MDFGRSESINSAYSNSQKSFQKHLEQLDKKQKIAANDRNTKRRISETASLMIYIPVQSNERLPTIQERRRRAEVKD